MYADFAFYQGTYQGSLLNSTTFTVAARDAQAFIDQITFGRLWNASSIPDDVKMAVCAVADVVQRRTLALADHEAGMKSFNNDGVSVSYEGAAAAFDQYDADLMAAADLWLPRSDPLRYRG